MIRFLFSLANDPIIYKNMRFNYSNIFWI